MKRSKLIFLIAGIILSQIGFWSQRMGTSTQNKSATLTDFAAALGAAAISTLPFKNPKLLLAPATAMSSFAFANNTNQDLQPTTLGSSAVIDQPRFTVNNVNDQASNIQLISLISSSADNRLRHSRTFGGRLAGEEAVTAHSPIGKDTKKNKPREKNPALTPVHIIKMNNKDCYIVGLNNQQNGDLKVLFISTVSPFSKAKHFLRIKGPRTNYSGLRLNAGFFTDLFPEQRNRGKVLVLLDNRFTSDEASMIFANFKNLAPLK